MSADLLNPDKIADNLQTGRIGRKILVFESTSSTNDIAAEYGRNKDNDGLAVFAEEQTAGRGRGGSEWLAGRGDSVLCSIVLNAGHISGELLSLVCAVGVAETVAAIIGRAARIKWPNDIIVNGRKIAGILVESKKYGRRTAFVVGIGINCHQRAEGFGPALAAIATSIDLESRGVCNRTAAAKVLLQSLDHWLLAAGEDSSSLLDRWQGLSSQIGRPITVIFDGKNFSGICRGIDPHKGLILQLETDAVAFFPAGQTRILK